MIQQWTKKRHNSLPSWIYTESSENNMCNRSQASLVAQIVKNLPAMQETWVLSLGWEDPLQKGMATHSSILAWRIPWREEPGRLQSTGSHNEWDTIERLTQLFILGHREKGALETEKKNTNEDSSMSRGEGVGGRKGCNFKASFWKWSWRWEGARG